MPIVGIGASAGGLEALEQFFRHDPANSGMAFVLVQHLDPNHASLLTEILQRTTAMPVVEALDQLPVAPNCVYVIPPNRDMAIFHGKLQLSVPNEPRGQRMPIDAFLRSLAEDQQENAIGIILSGTGTDGTLGLRAILGAGGVTLVQDPATAKYDGMPSYLAVAGSCTRVTPPAPRMARKPSVPSVPVPERMMPMAFSCWSSASDRRKASIGIRCPRGSSGTLSCSFPWKIAISRLGGMTYTQLGLTGL